MQRGCSDDTRPSGTTEQLGTLQAGGEIRRDIPASRLLFQRFGKWTNESEPLVEGHLVDRVIDSELREDVRKVREATGHNEHDRLSQVSESFASNKTGVDGLRTVPTDRLPPKERPEAVHGRPVPAVHVPRDEEPGPSEGLHPLPDETHRRAPRRDSPRVFQIFGNTFGVITLPPGGE